jgi:hypothetical protein
METKIWTLFLTISAIVFTACNTDEDMSRTFIPEGDYSGTFSVDYITGDDVSSEPVSVDFKESNGYFSSSNSDYSPAGGSGSYDLDGSKIIFVDTNIWPTVIDPHCVLSGTYEFSLEDEELIMTKFVPEFGNYRYELTKD